MKLIILVEKYIHYRKSIGEQMKVNEECLKLFCRVMGKDIQLSDVNYLKVKDFIYSAEYITTRWFSKYYALLGFYQYAISRGYIHQSPLPKLLPKRPPAFVPYIYSRDELRRIFKSVLVYKDKNRGHLDPYMIRVVFILLYSTGLRLSEALSLTMDDVDMSQRLIKVRETKFYKTRFVPFGDQLFAVIDEYLSWRQKQKSPQNSDSPFFITANKIINYLTIEFIFRRIRNIANIQRTDKASYQPRIHDLRHTFAVHRLISWYEDNKDVQKLLPILSTYLGHTKLSATSVYLTMTNDVLREAGMRFEKYALGGTQ